MLSDTSLAMLFDMLLKIRQDKKVKLFDVVILILEDLYSVLNISLF